MPAPRRRRRPGNRSWPHTSGSAPPPRTHSGETFFTTDSMSRSRHGTAAGSGAMGAGVGLDRVGLLIPQFQPGVDCSCRPASSTPSAKSNPAAVPDSGFARRPARPDPRDQGEDQRLHKPQRGQTPAARATKTWIATTGCIRANPGAVGAQRRKRRQLTYGSRRLPMTPRAAPAVTSAKPHRTSRPARCAPRAARSTPNRQSNRARSARKATRIASQ